ncbi:hypothetical protein [Cohnella sp. REN36]|uniref:hypothetical protein n=1 Tax=Cohnella sp. REN36 TaxID=2887347 RepID=UPI001D14AC7B|nr:hypothetical protein [Cohnella sp. REN36]MCC3373263.1 hypothetical protein [Cohnella sp. REN36]
MTEWIDIRGARENNLKNVSLRIPKHRLVVLTGPLLGSLYDFSHINRRFPSENTNLFDFSHTNHRFSAIQHDSIRFFASV